jgi:glycosyltransferase involved in cell wall biosynthesis
MPNSNIAAHACAEAGSTLVMVVHARYPIGEPRVQRESRAARDAGWRVLVVCLREPGEAANENVDGIEVMRLPVRHQRGASLAALVAEYLNFAWRAALAVARMPLQWRECVVQVHGPPDFLLVAAVVPKLRGARVVLDIHDLSRHMFAMRFGGLPGRIAYKMLALVERIACRFADHVITVHEPYRREINELGVAAEKLTVIMNAVDGRLIQRVRSNGWLRPEQPPGFTVAYHGTLVGHYGVDLLIESIARLRQHVPSVSALILGEGDMLPELQQRAAELGIRDVVHFSGKYLPIEETLRRVMTADCGVIPNRPSQLNRFALSSKLFEYVELGIPAVVSELETLRAHFEPDEVRFFAPGDVDELSEALLWVAQHPREAAEMAARARAHADRYSWDRNRARYLELLGSGPDVRR